VEIFSPLKNCPIPSIYIYQIVVVLAKFGHFEKKYKKSHFMLIFGVLLVCSLKKQGRFSLFVPVEKRRLNFAST